MSTSAELFDRSRALPGVVESGVLTTITFHDQGDGTAEVVTRQTGLPPPWRSPQVRGGWQTNLDRFADHAFDARPPTTSTVSGGE
jgi:hypothetical protein